MTRVTYLFVKTPNGQYKIQGWDRGSKPAGSRQFERPAKLKRLGPDGWHTLEEWSGAKDKHTVYKPKTPELTVEEGLRRLDWFDESNRLDWDARAADGVDEIVETLI